MYIVYRRYYGVHSAKFLGLRLIFSRLTKQGNISLVAVTLVSHQRVANLEHSNVTC